MQLRREIPRNKVIFRKPSRLILLLGSPQDMPKPSEAARRCSGLARRVLTITFALLILGLMTWAYAAGVPLASDHYGLLAFGLYGAFLSAHLVAQSLFAYLEHRRVAAAARRASAKGLPDEATARSVALTISAYQEDPAYLRQCLTSARALLYPRARLRVLMVVDGNREEDLYMVDMFREVFADEDPATYVWDGNYHQPWEPAEGAGAVGAGAYREVEAEDPGRLAVEALVRTRRCVCVAQRWGGKREVMYTAFKALGDSVDYVQVSARYPVPPVNVTSHPTLQKEWSACVPDPGRWRREDQKFKVRLCTLKQETLYQTDLRERLHFLFLFIR